VWVAVGGGTVNNIAYSSDGINWIGLGRTILTSGGLSVASRRTLPYVPSTQVIATYFAPDIPNVSVISTTSQALSSANYNTYFSITNSGFNAITLPAATTAADAGEFWVLRNTTSSQLSITLTNTLSLTSPFVIPAYGNAIIVISSTANTAIRL
jgi:hypothetical protein